MSKTASEGSKIGKFVTQKVKEVPSRVFASMNTQAQQQQAEAESRIESSGKYVGSIPQIGDTSSRVPEEDFESISGSSFAYNKNLRNGPFKIKGWTPFKSKQSDTLAAGAGRVDRALARGVTTPKPSWLEKYK